MTHAETVSKVIQFIQNAEQAVTIEDVSNRLSISLSSVRGYIKPAIEDGDLQRYRHGKYFYYSRGVGKPKQKPSIVQPREAPKFVPLTALPSALGGREGSNDYRQWASKGGD